MVISLAACEPTPDVRASLPVESAATPLPSRLSATGLYAPGSTAAVRASHHAFAPQYPLWTDGADKQRWLYLPEGTAIDGSAPDAWRFPPGTRLWKEFSFGGRRVETRFMEALDDGTWRYATYLWQGDGRDALLAPAAGAVVATQAGTHAVPAEADCRACHEGRTSPVLGFTALQLSPDRDPGALHAGPPRRGDVDLATLVERGLLRGLPPDLLATPPRIDAPSPTARAALGYLHGNCGGCHNAEGPLAPLGLVLAQSAIPGRGDAVLASALGRPSRFRAATRPDARLRVAPGHADASVLALRLGSRDPALQMPPIGSLRSDDEARALIGRWIDQDLAPNQKEKTEP